MSRQRVRRQNFLLAVLFSLLAVWAWSHRGDIVFAPAASSATTRVAQPTTLPQVYFGPSYSVAVLPFSCRRPDLPDPESLTHKAVSAEPAAFPVNASMLAFGLADSVIELLQPVASLQVTAAASSFFFADSVEALPVLGERLKVRHLLDGCVRQVDELMEIEVHLYDVRARTFEWSETHLIPVDGVFNFLNLIAEQTAEAVRSGSAGDLSMVDATNVEVWLKMAEGSQAYREMSRAGLVRAESAFQAVLELDPGYAPAWLGLARVYVQPAWPSTPERPGYEQSREAASKALELDSGLAGAHLVLSQISRVYDWDFRQALKEARFALELAPGDAEVLANASSNEFIFGRYSAAISLLERSISRNPLVLNKLLRLGLAYEFVADFEQSLIVYRQLLGLNPEYPGAYAYRARIKLAQANPQSALKESEQEVHPFWQRYSRILALDALDRFDESDPLLEQMMNENGHNAAFQLAEIQAMRGETELAFEWLERAFRQRDGGMSEILGNRFLAGLHDDPRWLELIRQMGLE